jgi:hypothetical protein
MKSVVITEAVRMILITGAEVVVEAVATITILTSRPRNLHHLAPESRMASLTGTQKASTGVEKVVSNTAHNV